ncbi:MAG: helix-turn-helix domain-containing protein [Candidatus Omnitrophica bacterium]|nr:helix-turn-helix domain-containing protein [Candidatus Omnitrophota bacterium]
MAEEKLLTVRDVSLILGVSEKDVMELAEKGSIPAYKIGGVYLRFKREQVTSFQRQGRMHSPKSEKEVEYSFSDKFSDFIYFNDFYILSTLIVLVLLFIIFRG